MYIRLSWEEKMNNKVRKNYFQMSERETFVRVYELKRKNRHCEKIV